jgi:hypothetical protein
VALTQHSFWKSLTIAVAAKEKTSAITYLRTSSAANVGTDEDRDKRQREAIDAFAKNG